MANLLLATVYFEPCILCFIVTGLLHWREVDPKYSSPMTCYSANANFLINDNFIYYRRSYWPSLTSLILAEFDVTDNGRLVSAELLQYWPILACIGRVVLYWPNLSKLFHFMNGMF